jgi:hypothetical protein
MGVFDRLFGKSKPAGSQTYRQIVERSIEELRLKTAAHDGVWRLGDAAGWHTLQGCGWDSNVSAPL